MSDNPEHTEQASPAKPKRKPAISRPYPRRSLEDCVKIAQVIKEKNGGEPWATSEVAKAVGSATGTSSTFFYWTAAARDFGLTEGTRDTASIGLRDRGAESLGLV